MPRLAELQKCLEPLAPKGELARSEEVLVADRRAMLRPAEVVEARFWAALAAVHDARNQRNGRDGF